MSLTIKHFTALFLTIIILFAQIMNAGCDNASSNKPATPGTSAATSSMPVSIRADITVPKISVKEVTNRLDSKKDMMLIDLRPQNSYDYGHIESAVLIPGGVFMEQSINLPRNVEIVLYDGCNCPDEMLSTISAQILIDRGYPDVKEIDGGYASWLQAGYPVTSPKPVQVSQKPGTSTTSTSQTRLPGDYQTSIEDALKLIREKENSPDFMIIDVRTPEEFNSGHLDKAVNIDYRSPDFKSNVDKLDRNKEYLIYCRSGARSAEATRVMLDIGFTRLHNLTSGITGWVSAGYPTVP